MSFWVLFSCLLWAASCSKDDAITSDEGSRNGRTVSIKVSSPGSLRDQLGESRIWTVTSLKVSGTINNDDLLVLREMAGSDAEFNKTKGCLKDLNMQDVSFDSDLLLAIFESPLPVSAFAKCEKLESIVLPKSVLILPETCFYGCTALKEVIHLGDIFAIGNRCFYQCSNLTGFEGTEHITVLEDFSFAYSGIQEFQFGVDLKEIPKAAFYESGLSGTIDLSAVRIIGEAAFEHTKLDKVILAEGLEEIHRLAFLGNNYTINPGRTLIQDLVLPKSLKSLGEHAFSCTGIQSVTIQSDLEIPEDFKNHIDKAMFYRCAKLERVEVADGVTVLEVPFSDCNNLSEVILPSTLQVLGRTDPIGKLPDLFPGVFQGCTSLESISIPDAVTSLGDRLFARTALKRLDAPVTLLQIGSYCFSNCTSLECVTLQDGLVQIGNGAFSDCSSLSSISLPNSVRYIESSAFSGCSALIQITLPSALEALPYEMNGVPKIDSHLFEGCSSLQSVDMGACVTVLNIDDDAFSGCTQLAQVIFPPNLEKVSSYAFYACTALGQLDLPHSVVEIEDYAFARCASLNFVSLPLNLQTIGRNVFDNCREMKTVEIEDRIQSIGSWSFNDCIHLSEVRCKAVSPIPIESSVFNGVNLSNVHLYVPQSSISSYRSSSVWGGFGSISSL